MTEVSRNLRNVFFHKIPPILKLEVGFFSDRKKFFADFRKLDMFISPEVYFYKKKIAEPFWIIIIHHSFIHHSDQKIPDFENSSWIFFHLNNILKFFGEIRRIIFL